MSGPRGFDQMWTKEYAVGEPFDPEEEAPMLERTTLPKPAPINTTGKPMTTVELPTHILVSDELVKAAELAFIHSLQTNGERDAAIRAALSEAAPYLWKAGYDAATKVRG